MEKLGDIKLKLLLDNKVLSESIRTALLMLKAFNIKAGELTSIKPGIELTEKNLEKADIILERSLGAANNIVSVLNAGAHTFTVRLLNGLQQGLNIANSLIQLLSLFGSGGVTSIFGLLGKIFGFSEGGSVPGLSSGDKVPAMLTPGEFVIRKDIVDKLGSSFFAWINGGVFPSMAGHYKMGGIVSAPAAPAVNNSFDVHIDRRGDVHVVQKALQKIRSNNKYFGG